MFQINHYGKQRVVLWHSDGYRWVKRKRTGRFRFI